MAKPVNTQGLKLKLNSFMTEQMSQESHDDISNEDVLKGLAEDSLNQRNA